MQKAFRKVTIKLTTVGYLNLSTNKFYKRKADFIKSLVKSNLDTFNKKVNTQAKAFMKICLMEIRLEKAKLIKGYSWLKSCLIATCKREIRELKFSLKLENRRLLF